MIDPVNEARALLRLFERSDLKDLHVRARDFSFFVARPSGGANPLLQTEPQAEESTANGWTLIAPHVASLVSTLPSGAQVQEGDVIATLMLLNETLPIAAEAPGTVLEVFAAPGDLVEFDRPILRVAAA